jgi:hypothetical protein
MSASSGERLEFQTRHENKIREINEKIRSWGQLPNDRPKLVDPEPFVKVDRDVRAHLMVDGGKIKIHTTNQGDLEISEEELGNRIGTGLDFLELLSRRLDAFRNVIFQRERDEVPNV